MRKLDYLMTTIPEERVGCEVGTHDISQIGVVDRLAIDRAAVNLAPGYQSTFLLHDVQGFQHKEIASMLNCTMGNSKSQLHKARRVLRRILSPQAGQARGVSKQGRNRDAKRESSLAVQFAGG